MAVLKINESEGQFVAVECDVDDGGNVVILVSDISDTAVVTLTPGQTRKLANHLLDLTKAKKQVSLSRVQENYVRRSGVNTGDSSNRPNIHIPGQRKIMKPTSPERIKAKKKVTK